MTDITTFGSGVKNITTFSSAIINNRVKEIYEVKLWFEVMNLKLWTWSYKPKIIDLKLWTTTHYEFMD